MSENANRQGRRRIEVFLGSVIFGMFALVVSGTQLAGLAQRTSRVLSVIAAEGPSLPPMLYLAGYSGLILVFFGLAIAALAMLLITPAALLFPRSRVLTALVRLALISVVAGSVPAFCSVLIGFVLGSFHPR